MLFRSEGLLRLDDLEDDWYDMEGGGFALVGRRHNKRYVIGDELEAWIKEVDLDRRELDLSTRTVETGKKKPSKKSSRTKRPRGKKGDTRKGGPKKGGSKKGGGKKGRSGR